jgi:hypothetical protein
MYKSSQGDLELLNNIAHMRKRGETERERKVRETVREQDSERDSERERRGGEREVREQDSKRERETKRRQ